MRQQRRVAWLTALAIIVGVITALAGIVNYLTAKGHLEIGSVFGSDPPPPSVAAIVSRYWWAWIVTVLVWLSIAYIASRATRGMTLQGEATSNTNPVSPMRRIVLAELASTAAVILLFLAAFALSDWF